MQQENELTSALRLAWNHRKALCLGALCGLAAGVAVALAWPKKYTAEVKFVAESEAGGLSGEFAGMRTLLGLPGMGMENGELLTAELYPDIVAGTPFLTALFSEELAGKTAAEADRILRQKRKHIDVFTDKSSGLTTVSATDADPEAAARTVDSIVVRLERTLIGTRTGKARADLEFAESRAAEARAGYYAAQQAHARFVDQNRLLATRSADLERQRLDEERQLAHSLFTQLAGQVEAARLRVQEQTPVLTMIEPAAVPVRHSSPKRKRIVLAGLVLGTMIAGGWVFGKTVIEEKGYVQSKKSVLL